MLVVSVSVFMSCETDVDLRAPYDDTPIVFGVLDQTVDTQFIKINKSFIGEGDNFKYAAVSDCTIFKNVVATVSENGGNNRVFPLKEMYVSNIEDGIFYADSQKVYYFNTISNPDASLAGSLDESAIYKINISIDEGIKEVSSETDLVGDFSVDKKGIKEEMEFAEVDPSTGNIVYNELRALSWNAPAKGLLFSVTLRFYYEEHYVGGSIEPHFIDIPLSTVESKFSGEELNVTVNGLQFYQRIANNSRIKSIDISQVEKREVIRLEFLISVANAELKTYMELNEPLQGIVQERPSFTNINGGQGVFSSRYTKIADKSRFGSDIKLSKESYNQLYQGEFTAGLKFCTSDSKYSQSSNSGGPEDFYCP